MAYHIYPENAVNDCGFYEFGKTIYVENTDDFEIDIFASSRYILFINGEYVCEGPCRGHSEVRYFDTASKLLRQGENHILFKVLHLRKNFTTVFKTEKPLLLCRIKSDKECFESDSTWECFFIENHTPFYPKNHHRSLHPCEIIKAPLRRVPLKIIQGNKCDFSENDTYDTWGQADFPPMKKRPIPMIYPREEISFETVKQGKGFIDLDAGKYTTARVVLEVAKNTDMKITYSECYEFENGKGVRDDTSGELKGYYDIISTQYEAFLYESYWFRSFRFIRIEAENPEDALKSIKAYRISYPLDINGSFECSNEVYNKMFDVSINTLLCCTHEIFVDCPYYEQQQYIMDATIEGSALSCLSNDTRLIKKTLEEFAVSQHECGLLNCQYPSTYTHIIPGFSLFWIFFLKDYLDLSHDISFTKKHISVMDKILQYFDNQIDEYGYVTASPYWDYVDWVPGWKHGIVPLEKNEAITIYNLYYAYALKCAEYICRKVGRGGLASEYKIRHTKICETINRLCFNKSIGLYKDGSTTNSYSAHTIVWAILSEAVPKEKEAELSSHLFDEGINRCSFSMNYYLFRALEKCGLYDKAGSILVGWEKMLDLNCTTWCENPDNPRSECHAWSCAPIYEFSTNILGVKCGFENVITIKPQTLDLTWAKGSVPTRHGLVSVSWTNDKSGFKIKIDAPGNIEKHLILPSGERKIFTEKFAEFSF